MGQNQSIKNEQKRSQPVENEKLLDINDLQSIKYINIESEFIIKTKQVIWF